MSEKFTKLKAVESIDQANRHCFDIRKDLGGGNYEYLAEVYERYWANMMAAAPDMYEALDALLKFTVDGKGNSGEVATGAANALAKARGES